MFRRRTDTKRERQERLTAASDVIWFHSIDLGFGVVSKGVKSLETLRGELEGMQLPDLAGKTVLDVGAWDGYFSFEAAKRGAKVVSLDHYAWALDIPASQR